MIFIDWVIIFLVEGGLEFVVLSYLVGVWVVGCGFWGLGVFFEVLLALEDGSVIGWGEGGREFVLGGGIYVSWGFKFLYVFFCFVRFYLTKFKFKGETMKIFKTIIVGF